MPSGSARIAASIGRYLGPEADDEREADDQAERHGSRAEHDVPDVSEVITDAQDILATGEIFRNLVVQRSRTYARESQLREVDAELGASFGQVGADIVRADWPAAVRNPASPLEVDGVEFGAAPAPDRRGASEKAQPAMLERVILLADHLAPIEVCGRLVMVMVVVLRSEVRVLGRRGLIGHLTTAKRRRPTSRAKSRSRLPSRRRSIGTAASTCCTTMSASASPVETRR